MKIYFAGSITGGRADAGLYVDIINYLKEHGQVLTEHIADGNLTDAGETIDVTEIFDRDVAWLEDADVVVAEVTQVSLGVGYELGISEKLGKKIICLYRPAEKRLSAMILGNSKFNCFPYKTVDEAKEILASQLIN